MVFLCDGFPTVYATHRRLRQCPQMCNEYLPDPSFMYLKYYIRFRHVFTRITLHRRPYTEVLNYVFERTCSASRDRGSFRKHSHGKTSVHATGVTVRISIERIPPENARVWKNTKTGILICGQINRAQRIYYTITRTSVIFFVDGCFQFRQESFA